MTATDGNGAAAPPTGAGVLALVGGSAWTAGCTFDAELLAASGGTQVLVLPTASAYEHPERTVLRAAEWLGALGAQVEGLMVLSRADAHDRGAVARVRQARFLYLSSGSALHLRSVLKDSLLFAALRQAWLDGAVVAGSGAGAMVLSDPMVDPRGGALTVGLGLVERFIVAPHLAHTDEDTHGEKLHRSVVLAPSGLPVVAIPERTALLRWPGAGWRVAGQGTPTVYVDGAVDPEGVAHLPA